MASLFLEMGLATTIAVWPVFLTVAVGEEDRTAARAGLRLRLYTISFLAGLSLVVGATIGLVALNRLKGFATVPTASRLHRLPASILAQSFLSSKGDNSASRYCGAAGAIPFEAHPVAICLQPGCRHPDVSVRGALQLQARASSILSPEKLYQLAYEAHLSLQCRCRAETCSRYAPLCCDTQLEQG